MAAAPFVSFCFSTYKRPAFLKATLESVRLQTFTDFEVVVSDNDPAQSGREVVEGFNDERFRYFPNEENLGMKKSFNKSLERSSGRYIVMIADDDPVYPDMLATLHTLQEKHPGFGIYLAGCDWFCTNPEVGRLYNFKVGTNSCISNVHPVDYVQEFTGSQFLLELYRLNIFSHYLWSTAIVKREILVALGGVPEYGTPFLGDYAYLSAVAAQQGCVVINRSLGCQTLHDENFGRDQNNQIPLVARNFPVYVEKHAGHVPDWEKIKPYMYRFTALWVVSHMSFLDGYYKKINRKDTGLREAEKEVFAIPYVRKFRTKYWLKKNTPAFHDLLVKLKKRIT